MKTNENTIKTLTVRDDHGQDNVYTVGKNGVVEIIEHRAQGDGDKWFYDVVMETGTERVFNFDRVTF